MRRILPHGRATGLLLLAGLAISAPGCGSESAAPDEAARKALIAKGVKLPPATPEERAAIFPTRLPPGRRPPPRR